MASTCVLDYVLEEETDPTYLDVNPITYEVPQPRRSSSHNTMSGRVHQDFGVSAADRQINLRTDWMEAATLTAFQTKFAVTGEVWKWTDHLEDSYLVFFRELRPERIRGYEAYRVEMVFEVVGVPA